MVQTGYQSEALAAKSLRGVVVDTYLPLYRSLPRRGVRRVLPLFERYLFVLLDPRVGWDGVYRARGVERLMGATSSPDAPACRVDDKDIQRLRSYENELGYVELPWEEPPAFIIGDEVRAIRGVFRDQFGVVRDRDSATRLSVLFKMMGHDVEYSVSKYDLVLA